MEKWEVSNDTFVYGLINFGDMRPLAENVMKYLKSDVVNIKEYYVKLGRHLHEFKNNEYYKDFGFDKFDDCISANLGLDKGTASRAINVYLRFADKNGLKDEYQEYNYSQLIEMVSMDDPQIISPDMSVKQIREKKKELKKNNVPDKTKTETVETSQPKRKECISREDLMSVVNSCLINLHTVFTNVCLSFGANTCEFKGVYIDVRPGESPDSLEAGKYKLVLQKVKE